MYRWLWRHLPGPTMARAAIALLLFALVVAALFTVAFPWADAVLLPDPAL